MNKKYILISLLFFSYSFAQYEMRKHSINSGSSSTMKAGRFEVKTTIGQIDASSTLSNGSFKLHGGFWQRNNDLIFKNNFK